MKPDNMPDDDTNQENPQEKSKPQQTEKDAALFDGVGADYNSQYLEKFLDTVFDGAAGVCFWATKGKPGYPTDWERFNHVMTRSRSPKNCYFGTATMRSDGDKIFNRQGLFIALHCLVLDDIGSGDGSKCAVSDLPVQMQESPTWILETSPDNFQYGYALEDPITNLEQAKHLVRLVYGAGPWDSGGAMPNKLVRLPCGNNTKTAYRDDSGHCFDVRLVKLNDFVWTPEGLLKSCGVDVSWSSVVANNVDKIDPQRRRGAAAYQENLAYEMLDGVVDPVLEWLAEENLIVTEANGWYTIICPNADAHTDQSNRTAGYSPIGCGGLDHMQYRGFKCFHDHCGAFKSPEFLQWVADCGGPEVSVLDANPDFLSRYVHNIQAGTVVDMKSEGLPQYKFANFRDGHSDPLFVFRPGGAARMTQFSYWNTSPGRLKVWGTQAYPGEGPLVKKNEKLLLNSWSIPYWPDRDIDNNVWRTFADFIHYLIPDNEDAEWFLDHLAMKVQMPTYRGPAVQLSTPVQGTGRGRLEHFIGLLWGSWNCSRVRLPEFLRGINAAVFNAWLGSEWLFISEAKDGTMTGTQNALAYETVKDFVEPGGVSMLLKHKHGGEGMRTCYGSVLISTNHSVGIATDTSDRRFKLIQNVTQARLSDYFAVLMATIEKDPGSLWHSLANREVSHFDAFENLAANTTLAQREDTMLDSQGVGIDSAIFWIQQYADEHCSGVLVVRDCVRALHDFAVRFGFEHLRGDWDKVVTKLLNEKTRPLMTSSGVPWYPSSDGRRVRPRYVMTEKGNETCNMLKFERPGYRLEDFFDGVALKDFLNDKLKEHGH